MTEGASGDRGCVEGPGGKWTGLHDEPFSLLKRSPALSGVGWRWPGYGATGEQAKTVPKPSHRRRGVCGSDELKIRNDIMTADS